MGSSTASRTTHSLLLKIRFQVIQSLTLLVGEFNSDPAGRLISQSIFEASAKLVTDTGFPLPGIDDSDSDSSSGKEIDASS